MTDTTYLEEQVAHLTRIVDDLSDMVAKQGIEIAQLTTALHRLAERDKDRAEAQSGIILADAPPPHY